MKKYKRLAQTFWDTVQNLRARIKKHRLRTERYMTLRDSLRDPAEEPSEEVVELFETLPEEERELQEEVFDLEGVVEREYDDVPFGVTRRQGVEGFWREVGGRLHV